jgi:hypothetical protein
VEVPGSDLAWMELQLDALFASDAQGRLLHPRWAGGEAEAPPRFFLGRTRHGHLWRFASDVEPARVAEVARLVALERLDRPLDQPPERLEAIRARLSLDAPAECTFHGPAFRFPTDLARRPDPDVVILTPEQESGQGDPAVLGDAGGLDLTPFVGTPIGLSGLPALTAVTTARRPCAVLLEGGRAASICFVAARSARAAEAGVVTLPGHRGRGLGSRAVAAWARAVAGAGLLPLYSTEWSNRASRALAARLGLMLYGVDLHLR